MGWEFSKYEGSGNDFLLMYDREITGEEAARLCDRHFGVGADGVIVAGPSERADFSFALFNADGSSAEVSGNGLRCLGKYLYDKGLTDQRSIKVEAAGEVKVLDLILEGGAVVGVRVDMGTPVDEGELELEGRTWRKVSTGNPHVVTFVDDVEAALVGELGPKVERHDRFPDRINVHFIEMHDGVIKARFWERGVGETLACGTGSVASLIAAGMDKATVQMRGGDIELERDPSGRVYLTGPANHVFDGSTP